MNISFAYKRTVELSIDEWGQIVSGPVVEKLETAVFPGYLQRLRWFASKGTSITVTKVLKHARIPQQPYDAFIILLEVATRDGHPDIYQLPICFIPGEDSGEIPEGAMAPITVGQTTGFLCDAAWCNAFRNTLLSNIITNTVVPQAGGEELMFRSAQPIPAEQLPSRPLNAEQSNTSFIYSDRYFLKMYRKVEFGVNPDMELSEFLSDQGFRNTPAFCGEIKWKTKQGELALVILSELVPGSVDGWGFILSQLRDLNNRLLAKKDLLDDEETEAELKELLHGQLTGAVRRLATRTAEMHVALASSSEDSFAPEPDSSELQSRMIRQINVSVTKSLNLLSERIDGLEAGTRTEAQKLIERRDELLSMLEHYMPGESGARIRIHGDYHLGQVLYKDGDFFITDFEGEPGRPYAARRNKQSPLRDVAGMIRSFHYAAYASVLLDDRYRKDEHHILFPVLQKWYEQMTGVFLQSYLLSMEEKHLVPASIEEFDATLTLFLLDKAMYELVYEVNNRPDWIRIPVRGICSLIEKMRHSSPESAYAGR
ncbi:MAG TPA: putative maltokinase [Cyclobacteriaceae bacterium]|nr:putative maltokinase [Cyclobacteriaceae bacterium]